MNDRKIGNSSSDKNLTFTPFFCTFLVLRLRKLSISFKTSFAVLPFKFNTEWCLTCSIGSKPLWKPSCLKPNDASLSNIQSFPALPVISPS